MDREALIDKGVRIAIAIAVIAAAATATRATLAARRAIGTTPARALETLDNGVDARIENWTKRQRHGASP
jgi:hypothetical protein